MWRSAKETFGRADRTFLNKYVGFELFDWQKKITLRLNKSTLVPPDNEHKLNQQVSEHSSPPVSKYLGLVEQKDAPPPQHAPDAALNGLEVWHVTRSDRLI